MGSVKTWTKGNPSGVDLGVCGIATTKRNVICQDFTDGLPATGSSKQFVCTVLQQTHMRVTSLKRTDGTLVPEKFRMKGNSGVPIWSYVACDLYKVVRCAKANDISKC